MRAPRANAVCERFGGTLRRECLDYRVPINERHVRMATQEWATHYNRGRPHSSLGPGFPQPTQDNVPDSGHRHRLPAGYRVVKDSVLGGISPGGEAA
jgi:transposase InsO family protein